MKTTIIGVMLACLVIASGQSTRADEAGETRASVGGKYSGLVQTVPCPGDLKQYDDFNDYGWWSGREYCGQQVSSGFWVYVHPNWYVWRHNRDLPKSDPGKASAGGKYRDLIETVTCPGDVKQYGEFHDYGHWTGKEYCGRRVSPGFWVYAHPDWYVWRSSRDIPPPEPKAATVNGKYAGLVQTVLCPGDRGQYGEFRDYGYWDDNDEYCGQAVKGGYWVYRHPYWYVWQMSSVSDQWK